MCNRLGILSVTYQKMLGGGGRGVVLSMERGRFTDVRWSVGLLRCSVQSWVFEYLLAQGPQKNWHRAPWRDCKNIRTSGRVTEKTKLLFVPQIFT